MLDDEANLLQLEKEKDEEIEKAEIVEEEVVEIVEQQWFIFILCWINNNFLF